MTLLCQFLTATVFKPSSIRLPYTLYHYYDIWCQTLLSIFANSLPRSQLIEQSSWQMFKLGGLPYSGELSTLLEHTVEPRLVPSVYGLPLKTVPFRLPLLDSSGHPLGLSCSTSPLWDPLVFHSILLNVPPARHPHSSCSSRSLLASSLYWILHTTMAAPAAGNQCPRGIWIRIRMYNWSWSSSLLQLVFLFYFTPSSLCLCLFSMALCLLCFWQTVYYFVDKCVFQPGQPEQRDG